jgi:hypothetical protein
MKTYEKPIIKKMHLKSYFNHMRKNLHIAAHMIRAAGEHFIHAFLPAITMKHDEGRKIDGNT